MSEDLTILIQRIKKNLRENVLQEALRDMDAMLEYTESKELKKERPEWRKRWARKVQYSARSEWLKWMNTWHLLDSKSINSLVATLNDLKQNLHKEQPVILEIGAGMGFLAYFLRHYNIRLLATDSYEWMKDWKPFTEVLKIDYKDALIIYDPDILIVCWGCSQIPLELFKGKYYCYIGEPHDGATSGWPTEDWKILKEIEMPCFYGLNDENIVIFERT